MNQPDNLVYAGDLELKDVWERLKSEPGTILIDVRTRAEWDFVGVPDLASLGQEVILIEWQQYPEMNINPEFVEALKSELAVRGFGEDTPLFFLCRSGARSRSAADAMTSAGFANSYNILQGFEGRRDERGMRGQIEGWKASNLPWQQK